MRLVLPFEPRTGILAAIAASVLIAVALGLTHRTTSEQSGGLTGTYLDTSDRAASEAARIEAAWQSRLQRARTLAATVVLDGDTIHCESSNSAVPIRSSGNTNADFLMAVAEEPLIVFLVPGFEYKGDGWQSFDFIRTQLADEMEVAGSAPGGSATCLVRWGTQDGFDEKTRYLTDAVAAVRELSEDPLLPNTVARRVAVVGYSAGGNFAKFAITRLPPHPPLTGSGTDLRLVTMATPHRGADATLWAPSVARLAQTVVGLSALALHDYKTLFQAGAEDERLKDLLQKRGFKQLEPESSELADLNLRFASMTGEVHHLNVYSHDDDVVAVASAQWPGAIEADVSGLRHVEFPHAAVGSDWRNLLELAFGPNPPTQEAVNRVMHAPVSVATIDPTSAVRTSDNTAPASPVKVVKQEQPAKQPATVCDPLAAFLNDAPSGGCPTAPKSAPANF